MNNQKTQSIILWGAIILGIIAIALAMVGIISSKKEQSSSTSTQTTLQAPVNDSDKIRGEKNAPVSIVEYSDFQCPACAYYYPIVKKIESDYAGKVSLVYRYFPLEQIHQYARLSAQAAEAAGKQGKFWQMHDILFQKQQEWANSSDAKQIFISYAQALGLNVEQFKKDLDSSEINQNIDKNLQMAQDQKLEGTPSFFINGKFVENKGGYDGLKAAIDQALAR